MDGLDGFVRGNYATDQDSKNRMRLAMKELSEGEHESVAAAARAFGVNASTLSSKCLREPWYAEWKAKRSAAAVKEEEDEDMDARRSSRIAERKALRLATGDLEEEEAAAAATATGAGTLQLQQPAGLGSANKSKDPGSNRAANSQEATRGDQGPSSSMLAAALTHVLASLDAAATAPGASVPSVVQAGKAAAARFLPQPAAAATVGSKKRKAAEPMLPVGAAPKRPRGRPPKAAAAASGGPGAGAGAGGHKSAAAAAGSGGRMRTPAAAAGSGAGRRSSSAAAGSGGLMRAPAAAASGGGRGGRSQAAGGFSSMQRVKRPNAGKKVHYACYAYFPLTRPSKLKKTHSGAAKPN